MEKFKIGLKSNLQKVYFWGFVYFLMTGIKWVQMHILSQGISNNFRIFRCAFFHLIEHQPLYVLYPTQHFDYYIYHPVFALLFSPFALLPEFIGLLLWLLFLTFIFFFTVTLLPLKNKFLPFFFILAISEFSKNIGHAQPNILNCALMLLVFLSLEKNKFALAGFLCALLFCIKGFGAIAGVMCFFYPNAWKTILYSALFLIILSVLPLCVLSYQELWQHYLNWFTMLAGNEIIETLSLVGFAKFTLHWDNAEPFILAFGLVLLFVSWLLIFVQRRVLTLETRILFLSFLLVWVVAFNRAAESPSYLYAVVGALLMYNFSQPNRLWTVILGISFYWITILPTDLSLPILKEWDKHYFFRPLFLLPFVFFVLWQLIVKYKHYKTKNLIVA